MDLKYVDAVEGAFVAFVVFILAVIWIPGVGPSKEIENILTISTFLFAILAGFFIARLSGRYNEIRKLVGEEDALFVSFYKTSQCFGKAFSNKIRELIDKYYIVCYDSPHEALDPYKPTSKYFLKMWDKVIKLKKYRGEETYGRLLEDLHDLEKSRNLSITISRERLSKGHWAILIFLSGIILFSMFYLRTEVIYSRVITVLLSTVLVLVLLIARDLQNLMLGGESLLEESGEEVFEFIGEKRYYKKYMLEKGVNKVPKYVKEYRLGLHKPGSSKFEIKLIKRK